MLTDVHVLDIQNMIDMSNSNEELLQLLKSYFLSSKYKSNDLEPLHVAWKTYLNIIQNNRIQ